MGIPKQVPTVISVQCICVYNRTEIPRLSQLDVQNPNLHKLRNKITSFVGYYKWFQCWLYWVDKLVVQALNTVHRRMTIKLLMKNNNNY